MAKKNRNMCRNGRSRARRGQVTVTAVTRRAEQASSQTGLRKETRGNSQSAQASKFANDEFIMAVVKTAMQAYKPEPDDDDVLMAPAIGSRVSRSKLTERSAVYLAKKLDDCRDYDVTLMKCLRSRLIDERCIDAIRYCTTLDQFLSTQAKRWSTETFDHLRKISSRNRELWSEDGRPTELGEEFWGYFHRRAVRKGALEAISSGKVWYRKPSQALRAA